MQGIVPDLAAAAHVDGVDQGQALLSYVEAFLADHDEARADRAWAVASTRTRHREHTRALTAVLAELADRLDCDPVVVTTVLSQLVPLPDEVLTTCWRSFTGKPRLRLSALWLGDVAGAIGHLILSWSVEPADARDLIGGARLRLYAAS